MASDQNIPLIDVSEYINPYSPKDARKKVIDQVETACSTYGFLQVKGHGVPVSTQRQMLKCCKTLFDLPQDQKDELSLKNNSARRGYERLSSQTLDPKSLPDLKEGFYIGREVPADSASFLRGPNQWPSLPDTDFHTPVTAYYNHMLRLTQALLEILVLALGFPTSALNDLTKDPVMNLKLLHYPPTPPATNVDPDTAKRLGAGAHTDFGILTVLLQQPGKTGLQVHDTASNTWIPVPAIEDVLVVNMGDLIQKWTAGKYASTVHRVVIPTVEEDSGDRYSVPYFYQGNLAAVNPFGSGDGETVEMHIRGKFDQSYGLERSRG